MHFDTYSRTVCTALGCHVTGNDAAVALVQAHGSYCKWSSALHFTKIICTALYRGCLHLTTYQSEQDFKCISVHRFALRALKVVALSHFRLVIQSICDAALLMSLTIP